MLDRNVFRLMRLEDGEVVVRLRGAKSRRWKSDWPHAGLWGTAQAYALVPSKSSSVNGRRRRALEFEPALVDRSADDAVLMLGSPEQITRLIRQGPLFCRALTRRHLSPEAGAALTQRLKEGRRKRAESAPRNESDAARDSQVGENVLGAGNAVFPPRALGAHARESNT